jgi:hypothetical protein
MYSPPMPMDVVEELPLVPTYANSAVVSRRGGGGGPPAGACASEVTGASEITNAMDERTRRGMCI